MKDDLDLLVDKYSHLFPVDYEVSDIMNFACRYVMANITDVKEWLGNDDPLEGIDFTELPKRKYKNVSGFIEEA